MIKGYGWIKEGQCGCGKKGFLWQSVDLPLLCAQLLRDAVLAHPIENFGRFNRASRLVALSVALSLYDANIYYNKDKKMDVGILGTSSDVSLNSNLEYFRDYAQAGRKLGRGNLFIYTLPSSPLAESAIHFGLQGPMLFIRNLENPEEDLLAQAVMMTRNKIAQTILTVSFSEKEAICRCIQGAMA